MKEIYRDQLNGMKGLVVVELYKPGCKPCSMLQTNLENLSQDYQGKLKFYSSHFVNGGLGQHFGLNIDHIPTVVLLKDGKRVDYFSGAKYVQGVGSERIASGKDFLKKKLDQFLQIHYSESPLVNVLSNSQATENLETKLGLSENSLITLRERYMKKDENGRVVENPEEMFRRVAENIASADLIYGKTEEQIQETANKFYNAMSNLEFLPNSPTLMNAGRDLQQLSACFVVPIEDTMESIFGAAKEGALIHKSGGGTGYSFSNLRPKNSIVKSTSGIASGPRSFIDVFNADTETVKQGGTRRGANMGILRVDHPDIRDFIHAKGELSDINRDIVDKIKKDLNLEEDDLYITTLKRKLIERSQLNNFNLSVGLTEEFMNAVKEDDYFELIDPRTKNITERIKANDLFEEIIDQAWKTGDPGIIFLDRINKYNPTPHIGYMDSTNPCGEQPLLPYESCNLGSINLTKIVKEIPIHDASKTDKELDYKPVMWKIDYNKLRDIVHIGVHFLDNVIDKNKFPLPKIEEMTKANRKIGLGVMGFADMLTMLEIPYGSEESVKVAEDVMKFIRDESRKASSKLAEERGTFPNWEGSIYDPNSEHFKGEELKLRNATTTTIAPTGTLSQIANCEWGIEAAFSLGYTKTVMDGKVLHYRARGLEKLLKGKGYDSEEIFTEIEQGKRDKFNQLPKTIKKLGVTSMKLTPEQHINIQAAFQKYTDNAVSKTINFPSNATKNDIRVAYLLAHSKDCKGLTIYRDKSKDEQILEEKVEQVYNFGSSLPKEVLSITREEVVGDGKKVFITTGYWENDKTAKIIKSLKEDGRPTQFFVDSNFFDPSTQALITALAIRGSKDLRKGIPPEEIVGDLKNLPPADEIGYDSGFGSEQSYINQSIPDAMWKAISGWAPPKLGKDKSDIKKGKDNKQEENHNGYGFCNDCSRYGVMHREGCDQCIFCGKSQKGCSS